MLNRMSSRLRPTLISFFAILLWPSSLQAQRSAADYYVKSLPGAPDGPLLKMHAGHIEVNPEHHGNLFFWHYQNRHIGDRQRTVIWINGGPGCSSLDGALMEIGPYRVREGGKLEYNDGSWDEFANLLFVDNPVGTGFSYVDTDSFLHELPEMSAQFLIFLEKFFEMFPEYEMDDIYIAGESYAGQHIPYISKEIMDHKPQWNLKGLLIGNGWISPVDQYPSYLNFAYENDLIKRDSDAAKTVEAQQAVCLKKLQDEGAHVDSRDCEAILQDILRVTVDQSAPEDRRCVNMYDIRLRDSYQSCGMNWPPDLETVTPYLRDPEVIRALHINADKNTGWQECNGAVSSNFRARNSKPSVELLPDLLQKVPVVLFSGAKDLICNHDGTEELIHNMQWNGGKGFELSPGTWAPRRPWTFEGEAAGYWQEARNLTYVLFYNSSHMVPFDYPRRTRDMLDRFMGVDIASIGGHPADSRIDGEKGVETSVGGHPNSTVAEEEEAEKLQQATWDAYYRSGEVALIVVVIAAGLWGYYVWKDRRRRRGYRNVLGGSTAGHDSRVRQAPNGGLRMESFRDQREDLEAADFDESELDKMDPGKRNAEMERRRYSVGSDVSDEDIADQSRLNGSKSR